MNWLIQSTLEILWLLLPASVANIAPVIAAKYAWLKPLNKPIDFGAMYRNKRLLGDNKTIRGLTAGVVAAAITGIIQYLALSNQFIQAITIGRYDSIVHAAGIAAAIGLAALAGDAVKSFLKRQIANVGPGNPWRPFDQIDYAIGALIVAAIVVPITITHVVIAITILGLGSYVTSAIGVALNIKKSL